MNIDNYQVKAFSNTVSKSHLIYIVVSLLSTLQKGFTN